MRPILMCPLALACLLPACAGAPSGSVTLSVDGEVPEALQAVTIDWDEEVTWTREVRCGVGGTLNDPTYNVAAADRSVGEGLSVALTILAFDGPGDYSRDEFQPRPALVIQFEDDDVDGDHEDDDDHEVGDGDPEPVDDPDEDVDIDGHHDGEDDDGDDSAWRLGSDSGGVCSFDVDGDVLGGAFECTGGPIIRGDDIRDDVATVTGSWSCSELTSRSLADGLAERGGLRGEGERQREFDRGDWDEDDEYHDEPAFVI